MAIRSPRVSSRNRAIRPARAAAGSPSPAVGPAGGPPGDPRDPAGAGRRGVAPPRRGLGEIADDRDLVAVDDELHRAGEPGVGQPAGEPAGDLGAIDRGRGLRTPAAPTTAPPEPRSEGGVGETMSVHEKPPGSSGITRLHGNRTRLRQEGSIAAPRADTSVTGAAQTNPRHT